MEKYKFLGFFSGALGLDSGLEVAGLESLAANEFAPTACKTIRRNRPELKLYDGDIRDLTAAQLMSDLKIEREELFAIVGGPPCQAFSTAGKRLGLNDERGNVFLHFIDLIGELRPKYIVIENVRGILSTPMVHRPHSDRDYAGISPFDEEKPGGALLHILARLKDAGYEVSFELYNTANFGVPQIRERVVMIGARDGSTVPCLFPTHDQEKRYDLAPWRTFQEAVEGLTAPTEAAKFPERRLQFYRMLKAGQNWRDIPAHLQRAAMGKAYDAGGGKVGFYRRLAWDRPAPTLVTCPTMPATDLAHPEEDRPLSVQEYARVQTFPDSWIFEGNLTDRYKQIGNAVPVKFGEAIGRHLKAYDAGELAGKTAAPIPLSRYRNTDHRSWQAAHAQGWTTGKLF